MPFVLGMFINCARIYTRDLVSKALLASLLLNGLPAASNSFTEICRSLLKSNFFGKNLDKVADATDKKFSLACFAVTALSLLNTKLAFKPFTKALYSLANK